MTKYVKSALSASVLALSVSSLSEAALTDMGGGLIYDDVLDVTWLQDANYARTQWMDSMGTSGDSDGRMNWAAAAAWASNLSYFDSVRNVTWDDWRLPIVSPIDGTTTFNTALNTDGTTDRGTARTTTNGADGGWRDGAGDPVSEMGHMYYVSLANLGLCDPNLPWCSAQIDAGLKNTGPFTNVQLDLYWSGTALDSSSAWLFRAHNGTQFNDDKTFESFAWAVRPGNVSAVPIPGAVWLFGSGLIGLLGWARRKR